MRSTKKVVVFVRHTDGKKTTTYPVSVHANKLQATAFKSALSAVHATGDLEAVKALAPSVKTNETGTLHDNIAFSLVELPYNPGQSEPETSADDFAL